MNSISEIVHDAGAMLLVHALTALGGIPVEVDDAVIRTNLLNRFGIEIGAGLGQFQGKAWRIGWMGHASRASHVLLFLAALEQLLAEQHDSFDRGASTAAANERHKRPNMLRGLGRASYMILDRFDFAIPPDLGIPPRLAIVCMYPGATTWSGKEVADRSQLWEGEAPAAPSVRQEPHSPFPRIALGNLRPFELVAKQ